LGEQGDRQAERSGPPLGAVSANFASSGVLHRPHGDDRARVGDDSDLVCQLRDASIGGELLGAAWINPFTTAPDATAQPAALGLSGLNAVRVGSEAGGRPEAALPAGVDEATLAGSHAMMAAPEFGVGQKDSLSALLAGIRGGDIAFGDAAMPPTGSVIGGVGNILVRMAAAESGSDDGALVFDSDTGAFLTQAAEWDDIAFR
jgi:hypothetical protein